MAQPPARQNCSSVLALTLGRVKSTFKAAVEKDLRPLNASVVTSGPQTKNGLMMSILVTNPVACRPSGQKMEKKEAPAQMGTIMRAVTPYLEGTQ